MERKKTCMIFSFIILINNVYCSLRNTNSEFKEDWLNSSSDSCPTFDDQSSYQDIQLVQGVFLQASMNIEKCTNLYTEELKTTLLKGLGEIEENKLQRILKDLGKFENYIRRVIDRLNEELLNDIEALVINMNNELQDSVVCLVKDSQNKLKSDFSTIIISKPLSPDDKINLQKALVFINSSFENILERVSYLFKRLTTLEKTNLRNIITKQKHNLLQEIINRVLWCENRLTSHFKEQNKESYIFVSTTVKQHTYKFIVALECLISKVGETMISVFKIN